MQVRKQQLEPDMEQQTGSKSGKEYIKAVYCHPAYLTYMQSESESEVSQSYLTLCDPWTAAHQAPLSMGFLGKNTGAGCNFFLQGIFLTQESNQSLHLLSY